MDTPKIILARHAQSYANLLEGNPNDPHHERLSRSVMDADITELGLNQSIELGEKLENKNITIVYVSPLRRALETALAAFKNHPNKPKLVCLPILRESLYSASDFPNDIQKTIEDPSFKDVDFSLFDRYQDKKLYWLEDSCELEVKSKIYEEIQVRGIQDDYDKILDLGNELLEKAVKGGEVNYNGLETNVALFERSLLVKNVLRDLVSGLKEGEKAVAMTHFLLLKAISAKGLTGHDIYGYIKFKNCDFWELEL
jgi:bisphosphoglycerate-dependent phosphoglycerate mutase